MLHSRACRGGGAWCAPIDSSIDTFRSPMTPDEYCQQRAAQSGSSFYYSFLFLPPARRRAITALYAFCREVDDVVDECTDAGVAHVKLAWWRMQVEAIHRGAAGPVVDAGANTGVQHPVAKALVPVVQSFRLPPRHLQEIIDGMEMDLTQHRYPDFPALRVYCHRVAGVVGRLSAEIFGYSDPQTLTYAETLGLAFQLTNIIRDIGEDARRDRIYLPLDELDRFGVSPGDLFNARTSEGFRQLMSFQIERALGYYRDAMLQLPACDRKTQRAGLVMAAIYQTLLHEIRTDVSSVLRSHESERSSLAEVCLSRAGLDPPALFV
jgi:15-cis-phytoene synthase